KLKSRVKSAMIYPIAVLSAAFGILLALMKWVVPKFMGVLTEMVDEELNPVTKTVLSVSDWIAYRYGWLVLICIPFVIVIILKIIRQFRPGRLVLDTVKLKLPVIGQLSGKIAVTRWTRTLGTL
ncbi:MAG: type II secretion system F family protein, partial [Phycisphaerae bacterium]